MYCILSFKTVCVYIYTVLNENQKRVLRVRINASLTLSDLKFVVSAAAKSLFFLCTCSNKGSPFS